MQKCETEKTLQTPFCSLFQYSYTPVRFLGWEDPLEKGKATHCSILGWRIPWTV